MPDGDPLILQANDWAPIVPELLVADLATSLDAYTRLFGFAVATEEPGRLVVLSLGAGQLLLRQAETPEAPGRHPMLHLRVADPRPVYERLRAAKYPIVEPMGRSELRVGDVIWDEAAFVVADPDGHLLRFAD